ncbi:uncharacterized protein LOC110845009 isoform X2 [Folsomia candida]|uniref:uncharacterized protein LOC110845009 isoform X2 n=1 Tax=Folsomia candida TaxID=158441 RepID=UPI0016055ED7|nr:uncharacterized protein LOC110845009 isoform X2 [Folsomia candida]
MGEIVELSPSEQPFTVVEVVEVDENKSTSCFSKLCNCSCCCACCGNQEIRNARKDLSAIITDWVTDASVATYHILMRNDLTAGILTYAIVFNAGLIITFTNFCPGKNYKNEVKLMRSEIWKMSKFYGVLMYIPSFFPICSAKLRLEFAKRLRNCELQGKNKSLDEIKELSEKMELFKEKALWDSCCEAFFEAFPQAVLQIVVILRPSTSPFKYIPMLTVFWGLYGITGAPIQVLAVRHKTMSWNLLDKLAAYGSNALRVLSSALFIDAILTFTNSVNASRLINTLWITFAAKSTTTTKSNNSAGDCENIAPVTVSTFRKKCPDTIISILGLVITILSFYFWISSKIYPLGVLFYDTAVVFGCYIVLMVLTCLGVAFGRQKLAMYHEIVADIPVSAYRGIKSWVGNILRKLFCSCR